MGTPTKRKMSLRDPRRSHVRLHEKTLAEMRAYAESKGISVSDVIRGRLGRFIRGEIVLPKISEHTETSVQLEEKMRLKLVAIAESLGVSYGTLLREVLDSWAPSNALKLKEMPRSY